MSQQFAKKGGTIYRLKRFSKPQMLPQENREYLFNDESGSVEAAYLTAPVFQSNFEPEEKLLVWTQVSV